MFTDVLGLKVSDEFGELIISGLAGQRSGVDAGVVQNILGRSPEEEYSGTFLLRKNKRNLALDDFR